MDRHCAEKVNDLLLEEISNRLAIENLSVHNKASEHCKSVTYTFLCFYSKIQEYKYFIMGLNFTAA